MATRSAIAMKYGRDIIKAVYCHWDGYPEYNGFILEEYYTTPFIVNELINMGPISSLGATIGKKVEFNVSVGYVPKNDSKISISEQCKFYNRDRGEVGTYQVFKTEAEFVEHYDSAGVEYYYLFDNGVWYVRDYRDVEWKEVKSLLTKEKEIE